MLPLSELVETLISTDPLGPCPRMTRFFLTRESNPKVLAAYKSLQEGTIQHVLEKGQNRNSIALWVESFNRGISALPPEDRVGSFETKLRLTRTAEICYPPYQSCRAPQCGGNRYLMSRPAH